jgi:protein gp37
MDWGAGYPNVAVGATIENQRRADERLGEFLTLPLKARFIVCEPLLERIDLSRFLDPNLIGTVVAGGESGPDARPLDYRWVLELRDQCAEKGVRFWFKQTGANFIKDGKTYRIERKFQLSQARRAGIDLGPAPFARAAKGAEED